MFLINFAREIIDKFKPKPKNEKNEAVSSFVVRASFHETTKANERASKENESKATCHHNHIALGGKEDQNVPRPNTREPKSPFQDTTNFKEIKNEYYPPPRNYTRQDERVIYNNYYSPERIEPTIYGRNVYHVDEYFLHVSESEDDEEFNWQDPHVSKYYQKQEYEKPPYISWDEVKSTIKGTNDNDKPIDPIKQYSIPKAYENLVKKTSEANPILTDQEKTHWENLISKFGPPNPKSVDTEFGFTAVTKNNYRDFFHDLLYIEEQEQTFKMAQYNMNGVTMELNGTKCTLVVPGLAEKRPSVLKKDIIFVRLQSDPTVQYSGWIQEVQEKSVVIKGFSHELTQELSRAQNMRRKLLLDVRFTFSRYPFFVQHRALTLVSQETLSSLFPNAEKCGKGPNFIATKKLQQIEFVNPCVENNQEQKQAIFNILQGKNLPAPYIIFGPPGTGKTITFVEAILQVKINFHNSHILVCAQSNSACNYIATKLYESGECEKKEILRLTASGRMDEIPEEIMDISDSSLKDSFKYRIIVCTLVSAGRFIESRDRRHTQGQHTFTHLFIDEAGQAAESEALIAIGGLLEKPNWSLAQGQLVLAGDPKQLGPVCNGIKSKQFGLGVSLLERLMANIPIYQPKENGKYDSNFITQLVRNFRSHEQILTISNELFYDNKLIPQGVDDDLCYHSLSNDSQVEGFPVVFHGVLGLEVKEGRSPSISNKMEIATVEEYIIKLLSADIENKVVPEEIGVVSPYALQVQKLKQAFQRHVGWDKIEVGSTETFQGREKRAIIVSTVRSKSEELGFDRRFRLGFVKEPKRFNVIMTRAQAKLIVVGNPMVLKQDRCWSLLIQKAMENSSYTGCSFTLETTYGGLITYQEVKTNRKKGSKRSRSRSKSNNRKAY